MSAPETSLARSSLPQVYPFPLGIPSAAGQSFCYAFAGELLFTRNPTVALFKGVTGLLISLIDSVVRPLFSSIFQSEDSFMATMSRMVIVISLVGLCMSALVSYWLAEEMIVSLALSLLATHIFRAIFGSGEPNRTEAFVLL
jgi:hypothetical protein